MVLKNWNEFGNLYLKIVNYIQGVSLTMKIVTAHIIKGIGYILKYVARWYDRKWTCSFKRTRYYI